MATPKQEKLIRIVLENMGTTNGTKTMGEMLKEAGYSEAIQKNPYLIFQSEAVQEGMKSVAEDMDVLRKNALSELKARDLEKEPYRDVIKAVDILTKNHQLLTGGETERATQPLLVTFISDGKTTPDNGDTSRV